MVIHISGERIRALEVQVDGIINTLDDQSNDLKEIKNNVLALVIDKANRDAEKRTVRKIAAYVAAITAAGIQFIGVVAQAYWSAKK